MHNRDTYTQKIRVPHVCFLLHKCISARVLSLIFSLFPYSLPFVLSLLFFPVRFTLFYNLSNLRYRLLRRLFSPAQFTSIFTLTLTTSSWNRFSNLPCSHLYDYGIRESSGGTAEVPCLGKGACRFSQSQSELRRSAMCRAKLHESFTPRIAIEAVLSSYNKTVMIQFRDLVSKLME